MDMLDRQQSTGSCCTKGLQEMLSANTICYPTTRCVTCRQRRLNTTRVPVPQSAHKLWAERASVQRPKPCPARVGIDDRRAAWQGYTTRTKMTFNLLSSCSWTQFLVFTAHKFTNTQTQTHRYIHPQIAYYCVCERVQSSFTSNGCISLQFLHVHVACLTFIFALLLAYVWTCH